MLENLNRDVTLTSQRKMVLELIAGYKALPVLWDAKHVNYQNQEIRLKAYKKLLVILKKVDPNATVKTLKKRIDSIRNMFNRERKKMLQSLQNGEDPPYEPSLWYYNNASFLESVIVPKMSRNNEEDEDQEDKKSYTFDYDETKNKIFLKDTRKRKRDDESGEEDEGSEEGSSEEEKEEDKRKGYLKIESVTPVDEKPKQTPKRTLYNVLNKQERFVDIATKMISKPEQPWEVIGKSIGLQLNAISDPTQKIIAEKLISDTIFYANTGRLTMDSFVCVTDVKESGSDFKEDEILYEEHLSPSYQ